MITRDKLNFVASKYAPDPKEVDYWIDLTEDASGNVIKSYSDGEWLPLNAQMYGQIMQIVKAVGLSYTEDGLIFLGENDNLYFVGNSIVELIENGDKTLASVAEHLEEVDENFTAFKAEKGQPGGLPELDKYGKIPKTQLPSYVDDVIDVYATFHVNEVGILEDIHLYTDALHTDEITEGELGKIYINVNGEDAPGFDGDAVGDAKYKTIPYQFRWSGTKFVHIDCNVLILGDIPGTAFDGGKGNEAYTAIHSVFKVVEEVVDNFKLTSDQVELTYMLGTKGADNVFTYAEHNAVLSAATTEHAGVMTAEMFDQLSTAASIPTKVVTDETLKLTDPNTVTLTVDCATIDPDTNKYVASSKDLVIMNASEEIAGVMTTSDYTTLHTTLPTLLATEEAERKRVDTLLENKITELDKREADYDAKNDKLTAQLNNDLKALTRGVGLEEDYTLPDTLDSTTHYLDDEVENSVLGCVEKLDDTIYNLHKAIEDKEDLVWYGVRFDMGSNGGSPDGIRTGNLRMHRELPIQSKMRGCIIDGSTAQNEIKYLQADDWTKYEDGSGVDISEGDKNYFVEIPEHYRLFLQTPDNNIEIRLSEHNIPGYYHVETKYIAAYEATEYETDSKLYSKPGKIPCVRKNRGAYQNEARTSRTANWNIYTLDAHTDLTWLFVVEYATLNCQKAYNATLTADGYHQGGLSAGVTSDNTSSVYSFVQTGTTDEFGNKTGVKTGVTTAVNGTCSVPRYRGVENPFGHIWKHTIDVVVTDTDNKVFRCRDYNKFNSTFVQDVSTTSQTVLKEAGYELQPFRTCTLSGFKSKLVGTNEGDLWADLAIGSDSKYYCDYNYTNPVNVNRYCIVGGLSGTGANAGLFALHSNDGVGNAGVTIGTRLTFYGKPTNVVANAIMQAAYASQPMSDREEGPWFEGVM